MSDSTSPSPRRAYEAEDRHRRAIEDAIEAACGTRIDFAAARDRELAGFTPSEPSQLWLLRAKEHARGRRE